MHIENYDSTTYEANHSENNTGWRVFVGDDKDGNFQPQVKICVNVFGSDNFANLSYRLAGFGEGSHTRDGNIIKWIGDGVSAKFDTKGSDISFKIQLNKKVSKIKYSVQSKNLTFAKQFPATKEEIADDAKIGQTRHEIAENYIHAIAFFVARFDGAALQNAFVLYRPKITDTKGLEAWCDQDLITNKKGEIELIRVIPQGFIKNSTLPWIFE